MLLEHEHYHGLGMDALVTACSWNTNVTVDCCALGTDALLTVCSWNTNVTVDYHALGMHALMTVCPCNLGLMRQSLAAMMSM